MVGSFFKVAQLKLCGRSKESVTILKKGGNSGCFPGQQAVDCNLDKSVSHKGRRRRTKGDTMKKKSFGY